MARSVTTRRVLAPVLFEFYLGLGMPSQSKAATQDGLGTSSRLCLGRLLSSNCPVFLFLFLVCGSELGWRLTKGVGEGRWVRAASFVLEASNAILKVEQLPIID